MKLDHTVLKNDEKAVFGLRNLYEAYGFSQYKMSKFEEYDLYVRNKDFLISDSVITFTDTNGRLMALKPDVTLSIIKNTADSKNTVQKVYYNENVYRVSKGTHSFKEIMQVGLESIGDIDDYAVFEVLMLAAHSLKSISEDCVLDISHLGIVSAMLSQLNISDKAGKEILKCIGEHNAHGIAAICSENEADIDKTEELKEIAGLYGEPSKVINALEGISCFDIAEPLSQLKRIIALLSDDECFNNIRIDFSVVNDMSYYNGIVFKGFINGIPTGILSGGQYDKLMQKMGRKSGAIGFAVYLDMLEQLSDDAKEFDIDTLVLYDDSTSLSLVCETVKNIAASGKTVCAQRAVPEKFRYKELVKL